MVESLIQRRQAEYFVTKFSLNFIQRDGSHMVRDSAIFNVLVKRKSTASTTIILLNGACTVYYSV